MSSQCSFEEINLSIDMSMESVNLKVFQNTNDTEIDFNQLESAILSSKQDGLSKLIKGSDQYYYQYFLNILNTKGYKLDSQQQEHFDQYKKMNTENYQKIRLRSLFMEYDELMKMEQTEKVILKLKQILIKINKILFGISFDDLSSQNLNSEQQQLIIQKQQGLSGNAQVKVGLSEFDNSKFSIEEYLKNAYTDKGIQKIKNNLLSKLDLIQLSKSPIKVIDNFFSRIDTLIIELNDIPELYNELMKREDYKNKFEAIHFKKLTLTQMKKISNLNNRFVENKQFVGYFFFKKYSLGKYDKYDENFQENKEFFLSNLNKAYIWSKRLPETFKSLSDQILLELLQLGIEFNHFDFDLFIEYLKNPKDYYSNSTQQQREIQNKIRREYQSFWHEFHDFNFQRWINADKIIEKYLEKYFQSNDNYSIFELYLEDNYLKTLKAECKLYKGEEVSNLTEFFTNSQIKQMNNNKILNLCDNNKQYFFQGDPVTLYLELKNIANLTIKIFQINMKNFYMAKSEQLTSNICLDGFIPIEEINFTYDYPPIKKVIKEFSFESIQKIERGTFIIEFIGNGLSSKAIIEKGRLCLHQTIVSAGYKYEIFDEKYEKLVDDQICIWINETCYKQQNGEIILPFPEFETKYSAIIQHGDFYQKAQLNLQPESFQLLCAFILNDEQIQLGQEVTIIIIPKLLLNDQDIGFGFFKEQQILVTCVNEKGIPQTFTYKDLIFESNIPLEIKFPITQQLRNIEIEVSGKIKRLRFNQDLILKKNHKVKFNHGQSQHIFLKQLLKFDQNDGYSIILLGKNGEPQSNVQAQIQFEHSDIEDQLQEKLITNQQGQIKLGFLKNIKKISSSIISTNLQIEKKEWEISNPYTLYLENQFETFVVGQKLTLRYPSESTEQDILFYKTKNMKSVFLPVKNLINKIVKDTNSITLQFEKKGLYILEFLKEKVIYQFNVLGENVKQQDNLIYTQTKRITQNLNDKTFSLENTKISEKDQNFLIEGDYISSNQVKLIALATTFFPKELSIINKQMGSIFYSNNFDNHLRIELRDNIYLSNLKQSEEIRYIIERKNQTKYVGNTLEKPQILLNRLIADKTVTQEEQILKQDHNLTGNERKRCASPRLQRKVLQQFDGNQLCDSFTEFLAFPGKIISQINIDKNHFSFEVSRQYSTVLLFAYISEAYLSRVLPLQNSVIQTKNLCHQSSLSKDKFYSTFRNTKQIKPNIPHQIQDITSTEIFVLDNLNVLFKIQKELMKISHQKLISDDEKLINQLLKWNQEPLQSQHKFYNQHQCDELNLFLYFKDQAYFQTYILKYISNKIEKSFIDYFLLNDQQTLTKYEQVTQFKQLNALEQALLIIYYQEIIDKKDEAQAMAQYMNQQNNNEFIKQDDDRYKTLFDTILCVQKESSDEKEEIVEQKPQESQSIQPPQETMINRIPISKTKKISKQMFDSIDYKQQEDDQQSMASMTLSIKRKASITMDVSKAKQYLGQQEALKYDNMREHLTKTFKNAETTNEYCEKHYRYGVNQKDFFNLIKFKQFYVDLVNHSIQKGFLKEDFCPSSFMFCTNNFTEILSVLALVSLPFQAPQFNQSKIGNKGLEINYESTALIFTREIKEAEVQLNSKIIINQTFLDISEENQIDQDGNEYEQDLNEFFIKKVYCCKIVVTNCSAMSQTFQLLVEIPNGSIPVYTTFSTKTFTLTFAPYQTTIQKYYFYFPKSGNFTIYPANISKLGKVIQIANEKTFLVYDQKPKVNLENINEVLSTDNNQDIFNYIENKNIFNLKSFNPKLLYHKFNDKVFYDQVMQIYRKRKFYDFHSFAFSLLHNNVACLQELFMTEQAQNALKSNFKYFKCSLFEINSIRILEYYPLIIKRVHNLKQGENNILNVQFRKQYTNYLIYLLEKPEFSTVDKLVLIYYLLLQERVNEAVQIFSQITEKEQKEQQLQFDYLSAYLDIYTGYPNFQRAREICQRYLSYPVIHWRNMFYEIINLFIEYDGEEDNQFSKLDLAQQNKQNDLIKKEETLACIIEGDQISITYSNLQEVKIEYYKLDIEVLFSNNPFMKNIIQDFSIVLPNVCVTHKLEGQEIQKNIYQQKIKIPNEISKENLFVTIKGLKKSVTCKYQPTSLFVQTMEDSGQIRVFNQQGQYLSKVYVKVYSKNKSEKETFHKDGYTDLRGRFDYASLSSSTLNDITNFSILVYHEELGSIIQQVQPPPTLPQYEKEIQLIGNKWRQQENQEMQQQQQIYNSKLSNICKGRNGKQIQAD